MKNRSLMRYGLALAALLALAVGVARAQGPEQTPPEPQLAGQNAQQPPAQLFSPQQLDTLVAPVALYPDALLSQVLVAATYPLEIVEATQWLQQNPNLQGSQLVDAARHQNWDASIQALVVFPDVINRLNSDIRWTTDLGNAFLAQQADVMNAVQRMRGQAMAAGKLQSNGQQTVTTERQGDQSAIEIQPTNPEVVYVPYYNPVYIWGPPAYGYYPPWVYWNIGFGYGFGTGIYIGGFFGGLGWGGWGWGPNWFHYSIIRNRFFFDHYGFGGRGFGGGAIWAHDPGHRLGVPYPNSVLSHRYGGVSVPRGGSSSAAARYNSAPRANAPQAGGWSRPGPAGSTASRGAQGNYRSTPGYGGSSASRPSPSYGSSPGANRSTPGYRPSPSYGGGGRYPSSPSYNGGRQGGGAYSSSRPPLDMRQSIVTPRGPSPSYSGPSYSAPRNSAPSYSRPSGGYGAGSGGGGFRCGSPAGGGSGFRGGSPGGSSHSGGGHSSGRGR